MTGGAVNETALALRAKALQYASELLQTPPEALDIADGVVGRRGGGPSITLGEIAARVKPGAELLHGRAPGLSAEAWFHADHTVFPYGVALAIARVDRDTGQTTVERLMIAYEVGRAVNPMMLEGQLVGGAIQGVGGALFEEFTYDTNGEPLSVSFADYLMPTLREAPPVDVLIAEDFPSPRNPLGLKGGGEGGINAVGAVIAGAIDDAIGIPGAVTRLPVTPQRLREIVKRATA
jgi:carbon-monoxide dehydrogenase large subunit/6-hydroxypseudooxynicotine dehydrogenase subunit gamma